MAAKKKDSRRSLPGVKRFDAFWLRPEDVLALVDVEHPWHEEKKNLLARYEISEATVQDYMHRGVKVPIVVSTTKPVYAIDGSRRVVNAREANRRLTAMGLPTLMIRAVREQGEEADLYGVHIATNVHRQALPAIELARQANKLLGFGKSPAEVCVTLAWKQTNLDAHLKLLDASEPVRAAVEAGGLSVTAAAKLATLPAAEQDAVLSRMKADGAKPTVQETQRQVTAAAGEVTKPKPPGKRRAKEVMKANDNSTGKAKNGYFSDGIAWVLGEMTDDEAAAAGYDVPRKED